MRILLVLALIMLLLTACTDQLGSIDIDAANNGQTIDASTAQAINIKLDSNITTGYKWNLATEPDTNVLKLVSTDYATPNTNKLGAGGSEIWKFQAVGRGTTSLKLVYLRPFDPGKVAKEFTLTVVVQ